MAVRSYRDKRRARRRRGAGWERAAEAAPVLPSSWVEVGTIGEWNTQPTASPALSVWVGGRFKVCVGHGFESATLARLIRTLEQLSC